MYSQIIFVLALKNVALNKVTKQSSTYQRGNSYCAVDGNRDPTYSMYSCTQTIGSSSPWWMVDLGKEVTWLNILHSLIVGLYPYHLKVNRL